MTRRRCRCWLCGRAARRVARGRIGVVGRRTQVVSYGPCPCSCYGIMLRRQDRAFVLRAVRQWERHGDWRGEYDEEDAMRQPSLLAPPICAARGWVRTRHDAQQHPDRPELGFRLICTLAPGHTGQHFDEHHFISWQAEQDNRPTAPDASITRRVAP